MGKSPHIKDLFSHFLKHSTVHGLAYVNPVRTLLVERLTWCSVFILTSLATTVLINRYLSNYVKDPKYNVVELMPIQDVPFPQVIVSASPNLDPFGFLKLNKSYWQDKNVFDPEDMDALELGVFSKAYLTLRTMIVDFWNKNDLLVMIRDYGLGSVLALNVTNMPGGNKIVAEVFRAMSKEIKPLEDPTRYMLQISTCICYGLLEGACLANKKKFDIDAELMSSGIQLRSNAEHLPFFSRDGFLGKIEVSFCNKYRSDSDRDEKYPPQMFYHGKTMAKPCHCASMDCATIYAQHFGTAVVINQGDTTLKTGISKQF